MTQIIGIHEAVTTNDTTVYDPTCGSGSPLLKVGDEAKAKVTLYGQEKDAATSGLARMNMILHNNPTAEIKQGNTLANPRFTGDDGQLKTFDFVVANPPFSDMRWSTGLDALNDPHERFKHYGTPPAKQGDYAYLLHIIRSLKSAGKGACIVVIDKENAHTRKGIFMIDASAGFMKDGPKNRLRDCDIHQIVDVFNRRDDSNPKYARMVSIEEIEKNDFNLNIPRYIDSQQAEDIQDIEGHLKGGIPRRDVDALQAYWTVCPQVRQALFKASRPGYLDLAVAKQAIKPTLYEHPEFVTFIDGMNALFADWRERTTQTLKGLQTNCHPKTEAHH